MAPVVDMAGKKFGRLTGLYLVRIEPGSGKGALWAFRCDCGAEVERHGHQVRRGNIQSCGCILKEGDMNRRHSMCLTVEYRTWRGMRSRCENPKTPRFYLYGGRDIKVCDSWKKFEAFYEDMGPRPRGGSLDRINVDGNYEPGNVRWATMKEQGRNRRTNTTIEFGGEVFCISEWAEKIGVTPQCLQYRVKNWGIERALTASPDSRRHNRAAQ